MLTDPGGFNMTGFKSFFLIVVQAMQGRSAVRPGIPNEQIGPNYGTSLAIDRIIGTPTSRHWAAPNKIDMHILPRRFLHW